MTTASDGTPLSPRATALRACARVALRPTLDGRLPLPAARRLQDVLGAGIPTPRYRVEVRRGHLAGVPVEIVRARGYDRDAHGAPRDAHVLLYVHGGGFAVGSPRSHRNVVAALATTASATVVVPDYRLSPEHPYPAAAEDVLAVHQALAARAPERLTLAGDSAGGNLALGLALALRDDATSRVPDALGAISPFVDLTTPEGSWDTADDPLLSRDGADLVPGYLGGRHEPTDPLVSPAFADLRELPPTLVQVGGAEALFDDAHRYAVRAVETGGEEVHLQVWPGMWHVHHVFVGLLPEADRALADLGAFLATGTVPADAQPASEVTAV